MSSKNSMNYIRNIGIIAHIDAGKTTTTERILYFTGKINKIGEVHHGEATMDSMDQEKERGITIASAATQCKWSLMEDGQSKEITINIIDTPGHVDFTIEVERSLRVLDGAVCVLESVSGVQPQTYTVIKQADKYKVPIIIFINKMDRLGADPEKCLNTIKEKLRKTPLVLQWPIGKESEFKGVIDILTMKAIIWDKDGKFKVQAIPSEYQEIAQKYHDEVFETICLEDDILMEKYMNEGSLTLEETKHLIKLGTLRKNFIPVLFGSAYKNVGVQSLLDAVVDYLPNPLEKADTFATKISDESQIKIIPSTSEKTTGLVFKLLKDKYAGKLCFVRVYSGILEQGMSLYLPSKRKNIHVGRLMIMHADNREATSAISAGNIGVMVGDYDFVTGDTVCDPSMPLLLESISFPEPVIYMAINAQTKEDLDKLGGVLSILAQEDPSFSFKVDDESKQTLIYGMGELHLEIKVDIIKRTYGLNVAIGKPQVAYRETITNSCDLTYLHKKQTGGSGQFAGISVRISPNEAGKGFEFIDNIVGGAIPSTFVTAVKNGFEAAMRQGSLIKAQMVDMKFDLYDGRTHDVDSSTLAFELAAKDALRQALRENLKSVLLEPIMTVEITVPASFMGDVIGDVSAKRGIIEDILDDGQEKIITSKVPLAEMFGYINTLRGSTKGMGSFTMAFSNYAQVPENILQQVKKDKGLI